MIENLTQGSILERVSGGNKQFYRAAVEKKKKKKTMNISSKFSFEGELIVQLTFIHKRRRASEKVCLIIEDSMIYEISCMNY